MGKFRQISVAADGSVAVLPKQMQRYKLHAVSFQYVCSGAVQNRQVRLSNVFGGVVEVWRIWGTLQTAGQAIVYSFMNCGARFSGASFEAFPLPSDFIYDSQSEVTLFVSNPNAGDTFTGGEVSYVIEDVDEDTLNAT